MEIVTFKIQEDIVKKIDHLLRPLNFNNRTEFIREAIREKLNEAEKEKAILRLAELKGSLAGKSRMSAQKASELASQDIAKKFGLKLD